MKLSPLERLEVAARRLVRTIDEVNEGIRVIREVPIAECLIKEHTRRAHTRCIAVKSKSRNRVKIDGRFKGRVKADLSF